MAEHSSHTWSNQVLVWRYAIPNAGPLLLCFMKSVSEQDQVLDTTLEGHLTAPPGGVMRVISLPPPPFPCSVSKWKKPTSRSEALLFRRRLLWNSSFGWLLGIFSFWYWKRGGVKKNTPYQNPVNHEWHIVLRTCSGPTWWEKLPWSQGWTVANKRSGSCGHHDYKMYFIIMVSYFSLFLFFHFFHLLWESWRRLVKKTRLKYLIRLSQKFPSPYDLASYI